MKIETTHTHAHTHTHTHTDVHTLQKLEFDACQQRKVCNSDLTALIWKTELWYLVMT
jgi:hypothetical protein